MTTPELNSLKEDVTEIKTDVKDLNKNFNDFRVFLADTYVKKADYDKDKNKNLAIGGIIATIISAIISYFK